NLISQNQSCCSGKMIPALSICRYYYEQSVVNLILMRPTRMVMVALGLMGNLICQLFVAIWMIGLDSVVWCRRLSSFTRSLKTGPRLRACLELKKSVKQ